MAKPSATELDMLCEAARSVWELAFPSSYRQHKVRRADRGIPKEPRPSDDGACPGSSEKLTERKFLKRCHAAIMAATPANSAALLDHCDAPASWSDRHTAELNFNIVKRRKRLVEARHSTQFVHLSAWSFVAVLAFTMVIVRASALGSTGLIKP